MSALPGPIGPRFRKLGPNEQIIGTCLTEVYARLYHWIPGASLAAEGIIAPYGRSRRCLREGQCLDCEAGFARCLTFVIGLAVADDRVLFELGERHRPLLEILAQSERSGVGAKLRIWRQGAGDRSPIMAEFRSWDESVHSWEITGLVESMSLPAASTSTRPDLSMEGESHAA